MTRIFVFPDTIQPNPEVIRRRQTSQLPQITAITTHDIVVMVVRSAVKKYKVFSKNKNCMFEKASKVFKIAILQAK